MNNEELLEWILKCPETQQECDSGTQRSLLASALFVHLFAQCLFIPVFVVSHISSAHGFLVKSSIIMRYSFANLVFSIGPGS